MSQYQLPTHWADALLNDDWDDLDDGETYSLATFLLIEGLGRCLDCDGKSEYTATHDAALYGVLPCWCSVYDFDEPEPEETWASHPSLTAEQRNPTLR